MEGPLPPLHHPSHHLCPSVWWRGPFLHSMNHHTTSVHQCGGGAPSSTPPSITPPLPISVVEGPVPLLHYPSHHLCSSVWWRGPFLHSTTHHTTSVHQCGGGSPSSTPPPIILPLFISVVEAPLPPLHHPSHHLCPSVWWETPSPTPPPIAKPMSISVVGCPFLHSTTHCTTSVHHQSGVEKCGTPSSSTPSPITPNQSRHGHHT